MNPKKYIQLNYESRPLSDEAFWSACWGTDRKFLEKFDSRTLTEEAYVDRIITQRTIDSIAEENPNQDISGLAKIYMDRTGKTAGTGRSRPSMYHFENEQAVIITDGPLGESYYGVLFGNNVDTKGAEDLVAYEHINPLGNTSLLFRDHFPFKSDTDSTVSSREENLQPSIPNLQERRESKVERMEKICRNLIDESRDAVKGDLFEEYDRTVSENIRREDYNDFRMMYDMASRIKTGLLSLHQGNTPEETLKKRGLLRIWRATFKYDPKTNMLLFSSWRRIKRTGQKGVLITRKRRPHHFLFFLICVGLILQCFALVR